MVPTKTPTPEVIFVYLTIWKKIKKMQTWEISVTFEEMYGSIYHEKMRKRKNYMIVNQKREKSHGMIYTMHDWDIKYNIRHEIFVSDEHLVVNLPYEYLINSRRQDIFTWFVMNNTSITPTILTELLYIQYMICTNKMLTLNIIPSFR